MEKAIKQLGNDDLIQLIELRKSIDKIIEEFMNESDATMFRERVLDEDAPHYSEVIKKPIWLSKMKTKNSVGCYKSIQMLKDDFELMFKNCETYNYPPKGAIL